MLNVWRLLRYVYASDKAELLNRFNPIATSMHSMGGDHSMVVYDWLNKVYACTARNCWMVLSCVMEMLAEAVGELV